jgi:hypothetical protein
MTGATKTIKRDYRVQTRLTAEMFERLSKVSEKYAIPISTLAAVAVSEFVIKKESEYKVIDSLGPQMMQAMQEELQKLVREE